jgi:vacuole morphology and inheritance protein 14
VLRNLSDRSHEKRKQGCDDLQRIVRGLLDAGNVAGVRELVFLLAGELTQSMSSPHRKGGLVGLAAVATVLGPATTQHLCVGATRWR